MSEGPGGEAIAVGFVTALRNHGVAVPVASTLDYARALDAVGMSSAGGVYWAGRATLIISPEQIAAYDRAFASYFLARPSEPVALVVEEVVHLLDEDEPDERDDDGQDEASSEESLVARYSPVEHLRERDFAICTPAELDEAQRLMAAMRLVAVHRRSRRLRRSSRRRGPHDTRRSLRLAMRNGGEPVRLHHLETTTRPRRIVLLCDVSGSMEPYARALVRFLHAAVAGGTRVEAFALGTRLTRLTRELSSHDPDAALRAAGAAVPDWSGGTRLGEGLAEFNDRYGIRGMARGAVVVILSDGWDRGDPEELAREMERLRRVAHRVVWVNPLKASPGYAPLARGMAAALPHVDSFLEGHSLASLEKLAEVIGQ